MARKTAAERREAAQILADADYWRRIESALGWRLLGFSWRETATFETGKYSSIVLKGHQRDDIINAIDYAES